MSAARSALAALCVVVLGLAAGTARAGLFDDEEARKAIVDLRDRIRESDEQSKARTAEVAKAQAQTAEQLAALRRNLLELNNQLEAMRGEIAKLRGNDEQLVRDLSETQRRQKDMAQALDERLARLEPAKVSLDGREFLAERAEKAAYDEAIASMRSGDFDKALSQLTAFQRQYPNSGYADSVRFWIGNAQYGRRNHKDAIAAYRGFVNASPDHPRAPEALLAMANSQAEMKDVRGARRTIEELMKTYPQSEAAQAGKERLATLK